MCELSTHYPVISGIQPEYAWDGPIVNTPDGVPYIGPHQNFPRHLFALGSGGNGLALGFLSLRILLRHYLDEPG
jgi:glycine/D-amino acid oxidase-like deaminating enzyme